jgi:tetratricopeptide (TPR) repeat protein
MQQAISALALAPESAQIQAAAALALARAGNIALAQAGVQKAHEQSPLDEVLNHGALATIRAAIALDQHQPEMAVQIMEEVRPYDLCSLMGLSPMYYRGLANMELHRWDQAAAEFQRVLDNRAAAPGSPYIFLSQLQLGRTRQLKGDRAGAQRVYSELDAAWKNADAGFMPLQQLRHYQR